MSTIVTRAGKGSPLTNTEVDANFTNLNTDKVEKSGDTLTGNLAFGDNVKAQFGAGSDLQIYHDGAKSVIEDRGTGALQIRGTNLKLRSYGAEDYIECLANGAVTLYYDNSAKLATTSTGIDVTGTVDGRDIATDGTKLDGVAASATANPNALDNVSEDTTPQLGGNLNTNGNDIIFGDRPS